MLTPVEFDMAVSDAMDSIPDSLFSRLENVRFEIIDNPNDEQKALACGGDLLGLYVGIPLTKRSSSYGTGMNQPDTIYIFREPIMRHSANHDVAVEQVRRVVLHEVGHYFGMDDEGLRALGY